MLRYLPFLMVFALWIWAFIDCLLTPEKEVKFLPKIVWVLIILLFGEVLIGPVAWLVVGRARGSAAVRLQAPWAAGTAESSGERSGAGRPRGRVLAPDDDPEFLASLAKSNQQRRDSLKEQQADLQRRREEELRRKADGTDEDSGIN